VRISRGHDQANRGSAGGAYDRASPFRATNASLPELGATPEEPAEFCLRPPFRGLVRTGIPYGA
jgi:hypothetical protein